MKKQFETWLSSLNHPIINIFGIDSLLSYVDDDLNLITGNQDEREILDEMIAEFLIMNVES
ncbi:hypothetical protein NJ8700_02435 [Aggregatibacter aphrophilus NJ8700]|jgi:hypothetical protein|uniref:Uncharacterized protein n=1 Tax=Aggregatibacter aphrophilus (strain NJ8700) TaxID=634176 RepID=D0FM69_AGGAN|nr:hypothetical protein [Aggregatibacter aphrophilus]ABW02879.1 hypothetical protein Hap62p58 [Aggregatibacter aphrophilus NJ8700]AKS64308.1 hypothetical protein NJ8700_02435 [Aggregatibacter aphrophilus NJ8700]PNL93755.1 hypothetical protein A6J76_007305 [Aggregatibacter aphrophilus]PNL93805.1 hypothetical protein A6J76_007585 [Aggregatibacter aphrophilus]